IWDERPGVGVLHSTVEAGEHARVDPVEGRRDRVMGSLGGNTADSPKSESVSTKHQRIAQMAKRSPQTSFTSLAHHLDVGWLNEAYRRTRRDGAAGVDGQTAAGYAENAGANLQALLDRAKSGQ